MAMLVEAPAAVEDALASLLDHTDPLVQRRALATYVRRLYYPFLLHEPELATVEGGALVAVWAYDDAAVAATPYARECHGGALVVRCLHDIPSTLAELERVRAQTGGYLCLRACLPVRRAGLGSRKRHVDVASA